MERADYPKGRQSGGCLVADGSGEVGEDQQDTDWTTVEEPLVSKER